jgi:hypothetical protein
MQLKVNNKRKKEEKKSGKEELKKKLKWKQHSLNILYQLTVFHSFNNREWQNPLPFIRYFSDLNDNIETK